MTVTELDNLRYPVGKKSYDPVNPSEYPQLLETIANLPRALRQAVAGLSDEQLDTRYREGGWTVRQVVHHLADSHMNAYVRVKLALTESSPTVKTYEEARWAELPDSKAPIELSLKLLESLHERWLLVWRGVPAGELRKKGFHHPDYAEYITLDQVLGMYAWHCRHHTAHITELRKRKGW
jgi:uncharacterized damage-inducible protein DinB